MDGSTRSYQLGTRNHLLITDSVACRGVILQCTTRLGDYLRGFEKPMLVMQDAEARDLIRGERHEAFELRLPISNVILAHEYVPLAGDPHLRAHAEERPTHNAEIFLNGVPGLSLRGRFDKSTLDWQRRFFVLSNPAAIASTAAASMVATEVAGLPYLLINRDRIDAFLTTDSSDLPLP